MKLAILGTAGYHPNASRHTTCVVIPEAGIVLDAGTGMFRLPAHLETKAIDIFLSHAHLDHVVGLTYLFDILHQHPLDEVRVHGEAAKLRSVHEHLFSADLFPVEPPYLTKPLNGAVTLDDCRVSYHRLSHPGGSVGFRVDWPTRSLAFITDTTADINADYVDFIAGVDLLLHECNFRDGLEDLAVKTGHSCLTPVVDVARKARVGGLVLLHFNPIDEGLQEADVAKARTVFSPIIVAEDGMEVEF